MAKRDELEPITLTRACIVDGDHHKIDAELMVEGADARLLCGMKKAKRGHGHGTAAAAPEGGAPVEPPKAGDPGKAGTGQGKAA